MSVIVLGLSHRSAPLAVLERASLDPAGQQALLERLLVPRPRPTTPRRVAPAPRPVGQPVAR